MKIDNERLHRALNPRSVVVVGDKGPQYMWLTNMENFTGELYSVQVDPNEIPGIEEKQIPNFSSVAEVPGDVDLVICAVPRQVTPIIVGQAIEKKVGGISMFTSGFAETGEPEAIELQEKIVSACLEDGMPLVGPNCMGVYNRELGVKFNAQQEQGAGSDVGVISQSGTHGIGISLGAQRLGIKVGRTISIGNAVVCNESDYLEYLIDDPASPIVVMYLEGVKEGRRFFEKLKELAAQKPTVIWRGGGTDAGARAAHSHTASLATDTAVWDGMIRQAGAIPTESLEDTLDVLTTLVHSPPCSGKGAALVAMTGGQSVAITDQFQRAGFDVPELTQDSYDVLGEFFVTIGGSYRNPFDAASTIRSETENLEKILEVLAEDDNIDAGVAIELTTAGFDKDPERLDAQLSLLAEYREKTNQPVVAMMPEGGAVSGQAEVVVSARARVSELGFPVYPSFRRGAEALARSQSYWHWRGVPSS
ncbi:MAG: CoA-binding protein [Chloroflexota bacterium]|jgi:acyl-CoA synthetase (NDP forming)|nr:CoA-binding protein [Chloroflexota bacterium]